MTDPRDPAGVRDAREEKLALLAKFHHDYLDGVSAGISETCCPACDGEAYQEDDEILGDFVHSDWCPYLMAMNVRDQLVRLDEQEERAVEKPDATGDVRAPHPTGWQPIDTAPKDGTTIVLFDGEHVSVGGWVSAEDQGAGEGEEYLISPGWWSLDLRDNQPTLWAPMPDPPLPPVASASTGSAAPALPRLQRYTPDPKERAFLHHVGSKGEGLWTQHEAVDGAYGGKGWCRGADVETLEAEFKTVVAERDRLALALHQHKSDIDKFWFHVERAYDIEPRAFFEKEARTNGFDSPLAQAAHHIWKREPKVEALEAWKEDALRALAKSDVLHEALKPYGRYLGWNVHDAAVDLIATLKGERDRLAGQLAQLQILVEQKDGTIRGYEAQLADGKAPK